MKYFNTTKGKNILKRIKENDKTLIELKETQIQFLDLEDIKALCAALRCNTNIEILHCRERDKNFSRRVEKQLHADIASSKWQQDWHRRSGIFDQSITKQ